MEILLVEDNSSDIWMIRDAIKNSRIIEHCHVVKDGIDALKFLKKEGEFSGYNLPDIIILDISLPKKDGFEVLYELKNHSNLHKIPVVILTSSTNLDNVKKGYDMFANCYIIKPGEPKQFEDMVKSIESFWGQIAVLPTIN
jgi:two-component system, chemotaxis family, response regulator Rcp1